MTLLIIVSACIVILILLGFAVISIQIYRDVCKFFGDIK